MQEIDLDKLIDHKTLNTSHYNLEIEDNSSKSRVGTYISKNVKYERRRDLEGRNSNILVIDIDSNTKIRLINVYRSFSHQEDRQ